MRRSFGFRRPNARWMQDLSLALGLSRSSSSQTFGCASASTRRSCAYQITCRGCLRTVYYPSRSQERNHIRNTRSCIEPVRYGQERFVADGTGLVLRLQRYRVFLSLRLRGKTVVSRERRVLTHSVKCCQSFVGESRTIEDV